MNTESFEKAKEIQEKIERKSTSIRKIEQLLNCCGVGATIKGTKRGESRLQVEHYSINREIIEHLLIADKEILSKELEELQKQFADLQ